MSGNSIFNATVCLIGILILTVHIANLALKKEKRKDEWILLGFFAFTILHFATYLTFTLIKSNYTSDPFIIAFYTAFYIMNNVEVFLLFCYASSYMNLASKLGRALSFINFSIFSVFVLLDLANIFTGFFFAAQNGVYFRNPAIYVSQFYQFCMLAIIFTIALTHKKLNLRERIAFCLYCSLPLVAIILQDAFPGYAIAYVSIILATEILFLFLSSQKELELAKEEEKNKDAQIKLMLSQIKPHFVYNSLSSISTLISIDPEKAQNALDDFTEYLRTNISSLTETKLIPFESELKHIETYVSLEKMRFSDRINIVYDVQATDFDVPPLSIQPIVENAIKHGILKKLEGGTLTLKTFETADAYIVEITDDGIGFSIDDVRFDDNRHFGLKNIQYRLEKMCRSELRVESEIGKGTKVSITFHKVG